MNVQQPLVPGASVYGVDGQKVGTMQTYGGSYIVVEKGFFFPKDYYIPFSAISDASDEAVYLTVTKDDALHQGWDQAPSNAMSTGRHMDTGESTRTAPAGGRTESNATMTTGEYRDGDTLTVPINEEHLEASRHMAAAGNVKVNKHVVTEQETMEVPVTEERVRVDWREPTGEMTDDGVAFEEGTIEIPLSREEVDVTKRKVQTGEVQVTKERQQRTQKVTGEVRREVVDVEDPTAQTTSKTQKAKKSR